MATSRNLGCNHSERKVFEEKLAWPTFDSNWLISCSSKLKFRAVKLTWLSPDFHVGM